MNSERLSQQPPHTERKFGRERLTHEQLRREFAKVALLAIFIAEMSRKDTDHLFSEQTKKKAGSNSAELLGLLSYAMRNRRKEKPTSNNEKAGSFSYYGGRFEESQQNQYETRLRDELASLDRLNFGFAGRAETKPADFTPAPSVADKPLGPELPDLAFNDRVRPWNTGSKQPTEADFAAASRANEMWRTALFDNGWRGGEATADQQKAARLEVIRNYHPDKPETSATDAEAIKMFNANYDHIKRGQSEQNDAGESGGAVS